MANASILTIGNFDGVHLGHQAILQHAADLGRRHQATVTALTFDPHPMSLLHPARVPLRLMTRDGKAQVLVACGAEDIEQMQPTPQLLDLSPGEFLEELVERYRPIAVVEGPDFRFGKDRSGDIRTLESQGKRLGFLVHVVDRVEVVLHDQLVAPVSSTLVRWLVAQGRVADAARCLGRLFSLTGRVTTGRGRGRGIGVPTANLDGDMLKAYAVPADGVYAGWVTIGDEGPYTAAINVGAKPTFRDPSRTVEAHLLDFDADLVGREIVICFARWVRDQQAFPGVEALKQQLRLDIELIRRWRSMGLLQAIAPPKDIKAAG